MKKSACRKKCKYCGKNNVNYYGYAKGRRRRYYCKDCKKTFIDNPKKTTFTMRIVNILYFMLKNDFYNERKLTKSIEKAKKEELLDEIRCVSKQICDTISGCIINNCENPKLIICTDDNKLVFYKVPNSRSQKTCKIFIE